MKNSAVRVFVLALAVVGFTASSVAASHSTKATKIGASTQTANSVPLCAPSDPTHCGLD